MENMDTEERKTDQFPVGMRVLAVDDNPTCLRKLEELLLRCKYHVTKTMESREALQMLRDKSNMFDLVISDVEMPDTDGFKLLEIGLEMDLPVIMLSAHSDHESVMKGIIHGACDYLVKPVGLKELRNIWQHVVKKNIHSYKKNIGSSRQQLPSSDSNLASSVSKKRKEKVNDSGDDENDSDREDESGDGSEQDGDESSTRKKPRVVWSQELHQKFVTAVQQLGLDKAVPKKILDFMNIDGLTRENVASHLQKYRLYLKKIDEGQQQMGPDAFGTKDSSYFHMAQLDHGLRDFSSTRQMPSSSSLLSRSHLTKFHHPSVYSSMNPQGINSSSFIQQQNSSNSANPFGTYQHHSLLSRSSQSVNLSPLEPLQFPRNKCSGYIGDFKSIGDRGIGGSFLDSRMQFGSSSSTSLPSASSNNLMFQPNYTQPLHRASEGNQSCLEGALSNSVSTNISAHGLSRFPSNNNTWQGGLKTTRFPSNSLPINHGFSQDQLTTYGGNNGLEDCTSLVSSVNHGIEMQCEPQLLGDFLGNMNTLEGQKWEEQSCNMLNNPFGNLEYPVPANNMVFRDNNNNANRSKGLLDETTLMSPVDDSATTLNNHQEYVGKLTMMEPEMKLGKPENALVDNQHDVFDDIMNEMMKQDENNGMVSVATRFGFDSFPPP